MCVLLPAFFQETREAYSTQAVFLIDASPAMFEQQATVSGARRHLPAAPPAPS